VNHTAGAILPRYSTFNFLLAQSRDDI